MKIFDYKFLIMLGLTLIVYFLYREVEALKFKVKKLENKNDTKKLEDKKDDVLQIELPKPPSENEEEKDDKIVNKINISPQINEPKQIKINLSQHLEKYENKDNETFINKNEENKLNSETSEEEQNSEENSESVSKLEIYSNDNEDDSHTSVLESLETEEIDKKKNQMVSNEGEEQRLNVEEEDIVELKSETKKDYVTDLLVKNKLNELQELAESLDIEIKKKNSKNGKLKNKTKLELANDIAEKKNI